MLSENTILLILHYVFEHFSNVKHNLKTIVSTACKIVENNMYRPLIISIDMSFRTKWCRNF